MKKLPKYSKLDIPNDDLRQAMNCFSAELACTDRLNAKCREMNPRAWKKCPKNNKRSGEIDRMDLRENSQTN